MKRLTRRFLVKLTTGLVTACLALAATTAPTLALVTVVPSTAGEVLTAGEAAPVGAASTISITATCSPTGATINWVASGPAAGPYPGTFTETGTVTLGAPGAGGARPVVSLTANFTIDTVNPLVVAPITGTKTYLEHPIDVGYCTQAAVGDIPADTYALGTYTGFQATIRTATGTCTEVGSSHVQVANEDISEAISVPGQNPFIMIEGFLESFNGGSPGCVDFPSASAPAAACNRGTENAQGKAPDHAAIPHEENGVCVHAAPGRQ